jgi:hypothetical protein
MASFSRPKRKFRIEDVLVVTDPGYEDFTDFLPTRL